MATPWPMQKRLQNELLQLQRDPPVGISINPSSASSTLASWSVNVTGAPGSLYDGEHFQLQFTFGKRYPFESPEKRPPDNTFYVKTCSKSPKKTKWWYHDDKV